MISVGTNIISEIDVLKKASVKYVNDAIRSPKAEIAAKIRQLRIIKELDPTQYSQLKKQLPYIVCAMFNPPFRKSTNFAYTEYFIIDIDHLSDSGLIASDLKIRLSQDERVMMNFISPGGDGIKVMFRLKERCYEATLYKSFYRLFLTEFSTQYGLQQAADGRTCDVARACFISMDEDVYFNPNATTIAITDYINIEENICQAIAIKKETDKIIAASPKSEENKPTDPDKETMDIIRQTLNPKVRLNKDKSPAYVPDELEDIMSGLSQFIKEKGITITEIRSINYGKKLHFKLGYKQAEINLFFGKHGFSVVQSPKSGTNAEMNALMAEVIENYITTHL